MIEFPIKGLCYFVASPNANPHNRGNLVQCDLFTEKEVKEIGEAAVIMDNLFKDLDRTIAVEETLQEFKIELSKLDSNNQYDIARVDRRFRAYIIEYRLFLEHWKKHIGDIKKDNNEYGTAYEKLFDDVTKYAYDNNESYVLAYVIRNYVVHGYNSINHCHINGVKNQVFIERDSLFKVNVSASAKSIIMKQAKEIDLEMIANESYEVLATIQEQLMDFHVTNEIAQSAFLLLEAKKRIDDAGIESDFWLIIEKQKSKEMQGSQNIIKMQRTNNTVGNKDNWKDLIGILSNVGSKLEVTYRPLNWIGYLATAKYISKLWQNKS